MLPGSERDAVDGDGVSFRESDCVVALSQRLPQARIANAVLWRLNQSDRQRRAACRAVARAIWQPRRRDQLPQQQRREHVHDGVDDDAPILVEAARMLCAPLGC